MPRPLGRNQPQSGGPVRFSSSCCCCQAGYARKACPSNNDVQIDNDEFCSACGNSGEVVCCDSCPRSYHFECVDMLITEDGLPDEWFCPLCELALHHHEQRSRPQAGLAAGLLTSLARQPPCAFRLRADIQNHFAGVKASDSGDYGEDDNQAQDKPNE